MQEKRRGKPWSKRKKLVLAAALLLAVGLLLALRLIRVPQAQAPSETLQAAAEGLNNYAVTLRLDPDAATLAITQTLTFQNNTEDALEQLVLRTWLNAYETEESSPATTEELYDSCYPEGFRPGWLDLYDVRWNGELTDHQYLDDEKTALSVSIDPLSPGETGTLMLRAVAHIPVCAHRTGYTDGIWMLCNVVPLLTRLKTGAGGRTNTHRLAIPLSAIAPISRLRSICRRAMCPPARRRCSRPLRDNGREKRWRRGIWGCVSASNTSRPVQCRETRW